MGSDIRVRMTKKLIKENFFELLKQKPLNKITVKSICEAAGINRSTFYNYFTDPYNVMETIQAELLRETNDFFKVSPDVNITVIVMNVLNHLILHQDIYTTILSENGDPHFIDRILRQIYIAKENSIRELFPNMTDAQKEWVFQFITYGSTQIIITWMRGGFLQPPSTVAEFINDLNTVMLEGLANKL